MRLATLGREREFLQVFLWLGFAQCCPCSSALSPSHRSSVLLRSALQMGTGLWELCYSSPASCGAAVMVAQAAGLGLKTEPKATNKPPMMETMCMSGQVVQEGLKGQGLAAAPVMPAGLGVPSVAAQCHSSELSLPTEGTGHLLSGDKVRAAKEQGRGHHRDLLCASLWELGPPFTLQWEFPHGLPWCSPATGSKSPRSWWSVRARTVPKGPACPLDPACAGAQESPGKEKAA